MIGRVTVIQNDGLAVFVELQEPVKFKVGEEVTINKAKKVRSLKQNALWWVFMEWLLSPHGGDLIDHGYYTVEAIHENVKGWFEYKHPHEFKIDKKFTTTTLTRQEFNKFVEIANLEFFIEELHVDVSGFWQDFERFAGWQENNPGSMSDYLSERLPF